MSNVRPIRCDNRSPSLTYALDRAAEDVRAAIARLELAHEDFDILARNANLPFEERQRSGYWRHRVVELKRHLNKIAKEMNPHG